MISSLNLCLNWSWKGEGKSFILNINIWKNDHYALVASTLCWLNILYLLKKYKTILQGGVLDYTYIQTMQIKCFTMSHSAVPYTYLTMHCS